MDGIGEVDGRLGRGGPTALVRAGVEVLVERFFEPLEVAELLREAWDGAAAALARTGVTSVPQAPAYPRDAVSAYGVHAEAFPCVLEELAAAKMSHEELAAAALRELAARRRDGHTFLATPSMLENWRSLPKERDDLGLVLNDMPPLAVADVLPGGAAQRAGIRRGQQVVAINSQPSADLRRAEAQCLLDRWVGATNELTVRHADGRTTAVELRGDPWRRISARVLPGPIGLLRVDGFAATDEETEELRAALTAFEEVGALGWIVDVRWCGGGVSIGLSRLLVDRGRLFSRVRHNEGGFPDGMQRQDIDADGTALPFQRPLVVLIGPGSISGAESFAGPLQALGRATLVGERTAGLCGTGPGFDLAPGWRLVVTTRETVFGPQERRFNRLGVPPDVWVTPSPEDEAAGRDPQLEAALEVLRRRVAMGE